MIIFAALLWSHSRMINNAVVYRRCRFGSHWNLDSFRKFFWGEGRLDDCLHIQNSGLEDFSLCAMKVETSNEELGARSVELKK